MSSTVEIFKPGVAELRALAEKYRGIVINGPADEAGYAAAKEAKKELAESRIAITKAGKKYREEALAYQREVIRQEKELLEIITPVEDTIKAEIEAVDAAKAREERRVLLPARKAMLAEIQHHMTDEEILDLDEKAFAEIYTSRKLAYADAQETEKRAKEEAERRAKEIEQAKAEAAAKAVADEKERMEQVAAADAKRQAEEQAKAEKNKRYQAWLKKHGVTAEDADTKVERVGNTFILWKKVDEIVIE